MQAKSPTFAQTACKGRTKSSARQPGTTVPAFIRLFCRICTKKIVRHVGETNKEPSDNCKPLMTSFPAPTNTAGLACHDLYFCLTTQIPSPAFRPESA